MLFYRVKIEANGKPYLIKRRGNVEHWSAIMAGELFTPNEAAKRGLDMNDLEAVEVNLRKTHYVGPYRLPDNDASITPVHKEPAKPLSHEVEEEVARVAAARPEYATGVKPRQKRGSLKVWRA